MFFSIANAITWSVTYQKPAEAGIKYEKVWFWRLQYFPSLVFPGANC